MSRRHKDLRSKIASLSALGAGALIAGADRVEASTIYTPVNAVVGAGAQSSVVLSLSSAAVSTSFSFAFNHTVQKHSITSINRYFLRGFGGHTAAVQFATTGGASHKLGLYLAGSVFGSAAAGSNALVGGRGWQSIDGGKRSSVFGNSPFSLEYALFRFTAPTGQTDYGWIQLSYSVTKGFGSNPTLGPDLTVYSYAWDNTGAQLPGGAGVPEPDTMALTGLGALALGAVGLRRWRQSKAA